MNFEQARKWAGTGTVETEKVDGEERKFVWIDNDKPSNLETLSQEEARALEEEIARYHAEPGALAQLSVGYNFDSQSYFLKLEPLEGWDGGATSQLEGLELVGGHDELSATRDFASGGSNVQITKYVLRDETKESSTFLYVDEIHWAIESGDVFRTRWFYRGKFPRFYC